MVTCEICGRQFKNTQGLRGHKTFVHGEYSPSSASATRAATEPHLGKLEGRLKKDLKEGFILLKKPSSGNEKARKQSILLK